MKILCSCGFFVPFLSVSIRVYILKEGDRMGHKDDVLTDALLSMMEISNEKFEMRKEE